MKRSNRLVLLVGVFLAVIAFVGVIVLLPESISSLAEYRLLIFGVLLLVVLWLAPEGILGTLARYLPRPSSRPATAADFDFATFLGGGGDRPPLVVNGLTIAFGGVPTGIMNPQLAEIVRRLTALRASMAARAEGGTG